MPSACTISDRSMNRHSAASRARSRRRSTASVGVACAASRYSAAASTVAPRVLAALGSVRQRSRDRFVRTVSGMPEVAGPGIGRRGHPGQDAVDAAELVGRRRADHGLGEQRMAEPDDPAVDRRHARQDGGSESVICVGHRPFERLERRFSRGRRQQQDAPRPGRQCRDAGGHQGGQRVGDRKRCVRVELDAGLAERPRDLQGIERVATGLRFDPDEREPRERPAQPELEQAMERRERHRPHADALRPIRRQGRKQWRRMGIAGPRPDRHQHRQRCLLQPPDGIGEDGRGALVEPLRVVDGQQDGRGIGQQSRAGRRGPPTGCAGPGASPTASRGGGRSRARAAADPAGSRTPLHRYGQGGRSARQG